jgi:ribosomal protein S18 acetylase RimI-like enzyme
MAYAIREAVGADYEGLLAVFEVVDACHREALPHVFRAPDGPARARAYVEGLLADERWAVFVAERQGAICGVVTVSVRETPDIPILVPRRYAQVDTLAVLPGQRRMGIGRALMARAHAWAREQGASEIELTVWAFNEGAAAFYEALGYATTRCTMSRAIGPDRALG